MKAQLRPTAARALCSIGMLMTMLMISCVLRAENCCRICLPEVHFQANSVITVPGYSDLGCVLRRTPADSVIAHIAMIMQDNPSVTMLLVGHADREETDADALSLQRARHIACELVSTYGIEPGRLSAEGKGTEQPLLDEPELRRMTKHARARARELNRRVDFRVTGMGWPEVGHDELAAVRFLSDPAPSLHAVTSFCDEPIHVVADSAPEEVEPIAQDTTPASIGTEPMMDETPDAQAATTTNYSRTTLLEKLAPMILTNPILGDEVIVLFSTAMSTVSAEIRTLDGRLIIARKTIAPQQGNRLPIALPASLSTGTYIVRLSDGTGDWSLRFVKP